MAKALVIGIAGGTGSGKTTLTQALLARFSDHACVVFHDNYYKRHDELDYEQRSQLNYDAPDAFDNELMITQLKQLIAGQDIDCPVYDYSQHNRSDQVLHVKAKPIIIVEGILIFAEPELCNLCDIKLYVDTDADVRIIRRIKRDVVERGRTLESVERQYLDTVKPMHELYVEPSRRRADLVVPEGGHNLVALDMIIHRIEHAVKK